jgi:hypothetical protein
MVAKMVTVLLGIGTGELLGSLPDIERELGRLVLQYGNFQFSKQGGNVKPIVTISAEIDLRKLSLSKN